MRFGYENSKKSLSTHIAKQPIQANRIAFVLYWGIFMTENKYGQLTRHKAITEENVDLTNKAMKTSVTINAIAPDLVKAVGELKAVKKDAKNPFLKNKYASLDSIIESAKPILAKHSLCVIQSVTDGVETTIIHASGEWISSDVMTIPAEQSKGLSSAQARGVAITYCKRYQLGSILGISTDEDTDGHVEETKTEANQEPKSNKKPMPLDKYGKLCEYIVAEPDKMKVRDAVNKFTTAFDFSAAQSSEINKLLKP